MKNSILYTVIFLLAFAGTTICIITFNNQYVNIFEFDLRDAVEVARLDSLSNIEKDSLIQIDSLTVVDNFEEKAREFENNYIETKVELDRTSNALSQKEKELEELKKRIKIKGDTKREEWLRTTIKLYEEMETRKAGDLLKSLPVPEASELIYAMKKKKAAEILSILDTETVKRLTRAK